MTKSFRCRPTGNRSDEPSPTPADTRTFLPREVEHRVLAEMIDQLAAEGVELTERTEQ